MNHRFKVLVMVLILPLTICAQNKVKMKKNNLYLTEIEYKQLQKQKQLQQQKQYQDQNQGQDQNQRQFQRVNIHSNDSSLIVATKELNILYNQIKIDSKIVVDSTMVRATVACQRYSRFVIHRLIFVISVVIILFILMFIFLHRKKYSASYITLILIIALGVGIWLDSDHLHLITNSDYIIFKEINQFFNK